MNDAIIGLIFFLAERFRDFCIKLVCITSIRRKKGLCKHCPPPIFLHHLDISDYEIFHTINMLLYFTVKKIVFFKPRHFECENLLSYQFIVLISQPPKNCETQNQCDHSRSYPRAIAWQRQKTKNLKKKTFIDYKIETYTWFFPFPLIHKKT